MVYEVTQDAISVNLLATGVEEILQNVAMILSTPKGTVPFNRNFGIDMSTLDLPIDVAKNICTAKIIEAIQDNEPRVTVIAVTYESNHLIGLLKAKVQVEINEY